MAGGMMEGFFRKGVRLTIMHDNRTVDIDLHRCIDGNKLFFKEVFDGAFAFFARVHANPTTPVDPESNTKWEIPSVLETCGVTEENKAMLVDAIGSTAQTHAKLTLPEGYGIGRGGLVIRAVAEHGPDAWEVAT